MKRYTCSCVQVPTAGAQPSGYGINLMAADASTAANEALNIVRQIFPSAVASWVDSVQVISDAVV